MTARSVSPLLDVLVVFAAVYALQLLASLVNVMAGFFVLSPPLAENPWTVVTSVYAHDNAGHLVSNAIALVVFGFPVAAATTRLRFHAFFLGTGAVAGLSQVLLSDLFAGLPVVGITATSVLGASGAVFALLGYLLASNRLVAGFGAIADVPRWVTYFVFLVLAGVLTIVTASPGVALIAHFTGLLLGFLSGRVHLLRPRDSPEPPAAANY